MGKHFSVFAPKNTKFHFRGNEIIMVKQTFSFFNVVASLLNHTLSYKNYQNLASD